MKNVESQYAQLTRYGHDTIPFAAIEQVRGVSE
jgi:hypothetical protein